MSAGTIATWLANMLPGKAGTTTPKVIFESEDGILICYGKTVPTDASTGYSPGCLFIHVDASGSAWLYINEGTKASSDFDYVAAGT